MCRRGVACPKRSTTLLIDTIRSWRQVPHRASICQPASSPIGVRAKDDGLQSVSCAQDAVSRTARKPAAASATAKCEPVPTTMRGQPPPTRAAATLRTFATLSKATGSGAASRSDIPERLMRERRKNKHLPCRDVRRRSEPVYLVKFLVSRFSMAANSIEAIDFVGVPGPMMMSTMSTL